MKRRLTIVPVIVATFLLLTASIAAAIFNDTTSNTGNSFQSNTSLYGPYRDIIVGDNATNYWRLGGNGSGTTSVSSDEFNEDGVWSDFRSGKIALVPSPTDPGDQVLQMTASNQPAHGASKTLNQAIGTNWTAEGWLYRNDTGSGSLALTNNGNNGYSVTVNHATNTLTIERRTNAAPTLIPGASTAFDPPEATWYKISLVRAGNTLTARAFDSAGNVVATTTATDATTTTFDRVFLHGEQDLYADEVFVGVPSTTAIAPDETGGLNGTYVGSPTYSQPALIFGSTNNSVQLNATSRVTLPNGAALNSNAAGYAAKSVELWFNTSNVTTRQILWEQGGVTAGMNLYVSGGQLYTRSWSGGWSQTLQVTAPVSANNTYHVVATLDATTNRRLILYVNGQPVGTSTKTDTNVLAVHTNGSAIGGLSGETQFHDGPVTTGTYGLLGRIDEVVHYNNIVLAPLTVLNHYGAGT